MASEKWPGQMGRPVYALIDVNKDRVVWVYIEKRGEINGADRGAMHSR